MQSNQTSVRGGYQDILFPHANMNITQGNNGQFTHRGVNALDLAEADAGRSPMYAPFDVKCVALDIPSNGNAAFWESINPVRFADGTIDYATIMIIHDDDMTGIFVGATYKQGVQIATEGTAGYATGNHNHFEIAKGKFHHMYDRNAQGTYHLPKSISADQACFIDGTNIINGNGMAWKSLADVKVDENANVAPAPQPTPQPKAPDQILNIGSIVEFARGLRVERFNQATGMIFNTRIGGWINPSICYEDTANDGAQDQYFATTNATFTIQGKFTVTDIALRGNVWDVFLKELGFWVHCEPLIEVVDA